MSRPTLTLPRKPQQQPTASIGQALQGMAQALQALPAPAAVPAPAPAAKPASAPAPTACACKCEQSHAALSLEIQMRAVRALEMLVEMVAESAKRRAREAARA